MKPLISVIIPVYNISDYVTRCLKSVCDQSYENLEIIVIDDGSTDGSGEICDKFAKQDKRVKVFHRKNGGVSATRNYGIKKSQGKSIVQVDGDDFVRKNFVSELVRNSWDADIVVCGYNDVTPQKIEMSGKEATIQLLLHQKNLEIVAWNKLYRRELFKKVSYPENEKHDDTFTTYKLMAAAKKVVYIPKSLYIYEKRGGSIMGQAGMLARLEAREKAAHEAIRYFSSDLDLKQAAEIALLTAKYAFIDAALRGEIDKKYYEESQRWILSHQKKYKDNKYLTNKLKIYNFMINGFLYKIFRKIRHQ